MSLFRPLEIGIEKTAGTTRLEKDPEEWPSEIVSESYRQHPFLTAFETDLELQRVDQARGYAVGRLLVYPPKMEKEAAAQSGRIVAFPVIVREREMAPLDVFQHKEEWHPLVESQVQNIMYQPALVGRPALMDQFNGGTDITSQTDPASFSGQGDAGINSFTKSASVKLWDALSPTFISAHIDEFKGELRSSPDLRVAFSQPGLRSSVESLAQHKEVLASDIRATRHESTAPTVIQFIESGSGYILKTANHKAFTPTEKKVSRHEVEASLSKTAMERLRTDGHVTLVTSPVTAAPEVQKTAQVADRVGLYSGWAGSKQMQGLCVPVVVDLDGRNLDMALFIGEDAHAMQEKVAGVFVDDVKVVHHEPKGLGTFVYQVGATGVATEPVTITGRGSIGEGKEKLSFVHAVRMSTGEPLFLSFVPGLKKIASSRQGHYSIPTTMAFVPISGKHVRMASDVEGAELFEHEKLASAAESVTLNSNGDYYWLSGENSSYAFEGQYFDKAGAEFALGALGVAGKQARHLMEKVASTCTVTIPKTRPVVPEGLALLGFMEKAASAFSKIPDLRVNLRKEIAVLSMEKTASLRQVDKDTADAVLSLGFITPENVTLYVDYLPELEKSACRLAEILVASRLGMDVVKEGAASNALHQLNTVISGLHDLQSQIQ